MQINYLDWEVINADEMYKIADEANVPVIVMEPLRGGQLCNLPKKAQERLMLRCVLSTLVGETIDAFIFITIAFAFTMPVNILITMIIAQAIFKTIYEIIMYPLTRTIIRKVKKIEEVK